jgi:hypothetical protein
MISTLITLPQTQTFYTFSLHTKPQHYLLITHHFSTKGAQLSSKILAQSNFLNITKTQKNSPFLYLHSLNFSPPRVQFNSNKKAIQRQEEKNAKRQQKLNYSKRSFLCKRLQQRSLFATFCCAFSCLSNRFLLRLHKFSGRVQ